MSDTDAMVFLQACIPQNNDDVWSICRFEVPLARLPPIEYVCFTREGMGHGQSLYHGCLLSQAHSILRNGFRVGPGTHLHNGRSTTGVFGFTAGQFGNSLGLAIECTLAERCTETIKGNKICGWGVPVVVKMSLPEPFTRLHLVRDCWKSVWEQPQGLNIRLLRTKISIYVPRERLERYNLLATEPALHFDRRVTCDDFGGRILCCGKWSDIQYGRRCGMPTCGRIMDHDKLNINGWTKGGGSNMWYCIECYTWMTAHVI